MDNTERMLQRLLAVQVSTICRAVCLATQSDDPSFPLDAYEVGFPLESLPANAPALTRPTVYLTTEEDDLMERCKLELDAVGLVCRFTNPQELVLAVSL